MASSRRSPASSQRRGDALDPPGAVERALRSSLHGPTLAQARVGIAWSGGLDSTVLLHACVALLGAQRVTAFHVHHDLQAAADDFAAHCARVAADWGVGLQVLRLARPPSMDEGAEAWARAQRYRIIAQAARDAGVALTLTAHHRDDQAETVLHRLMRGSGAAGMSAIRPILEAHGHVFARPLLGVPRSALQAYATRHALRWVEDPTNDDHRFTRNAIRHRVLPTIEAVAPGAAERIARAAAHWQEANAALNAYLDADLARMVTPVEPGSLQVAPDSPHASDAPVREVQAMSVLDATELIAMPLPRAQLLLRRWIERGGARAPDQARSEQITQQLLAPDGVYAHLEHEGISLLRYRAQVYLVPAGAQMLERLARCRLQQPFVWSDAPDATSARDQTATLVAPYPALRLQRVVSGAGLPAAWFDGRALSVHSHWPMSARLRVRGTRNARSLKDLLQGAGVPEWLRPLAFALVDSDEAIAVAGVGAAGGLPWTESGERWSVMLDWGPSDGKDLLPEVRLARSRIGDRLI